MTAAARKRIWAVIRLVLCAAFIALAVRGVTIRDRVTLVAGEEGRSLRLLSETQTGVLVEEPDGERVEVPWAQVAREPDGSPRIERGLATALRSANPYYLACGLLIFAPVTFLQSARFRMMLQAQDIRITYWESTKLCFAGNFLNFVFLLGSTAGDVYRAYYTAAHTPRKIEAVTTILLDRIVGLVGLVIVAGTMSMVGTANPTVRHLGIVALVLLGGVFAGLALISYGRGPVAVIRRILLRLPGAAMLDRVLTSAERLAADRARLAACVAIATVLQFIAVGAAVVLAFALGMNFSGGKTWDYFAYIGGGHMVAAIPITAQGLGTMELAYKHFFLGAYGTLAQLLCLALWIRLMNLLWALPGALVALLGAQRPRNLTSLEAAAGEAPAPAGAGPAER